MKFKRYFPALLWSGIIFFACLLPGNDLPKNDFLDKIYFDKITHAFMYFVLFRLMIRGMKNNVVSIKKQMMIAATLCIAQGILIEFLQGSSFIKNRSFELADIAANIFGVFVAMMWVWHKNKAI